MLALAEPLGFTIAFTKRSFDNFLFTKSCNQKLFLLLSFVPPYFIWLLQLQIVIQVSHTIHLHNLTVISQESETFALWLLGMTRFNMVPTHALLLYPTGTACIRVHINATV